MKKRDRDIQPPAVGSSSLLVAFALLCLTVFALLSLSTVQAEKRLSQSSAQAVESYYRADCQAEAVLARLRDGQLPEGVTVDGDVYAYTCPISDTQSLEVQVRMEGEQWTVLRWQAVSTAQWEAEERLDLWSGTLMS